MILPIVFVGVALVFTLYSIFLKNEAYKKLFFFLSLLFVLITFVSLYGKETEVCLNFENTSNSCLEWQKSVEMPGTEALIYGLGLLVIVFLAMFALEIIGKVVKSTF